ncbi:MAG: hypothetical protein IK075_09140 [Prevotella sp.]|nr:hypothetical protein [Prevotella sp.]
MKTKNKTIRISVIQIVLVLSVLHIMAQNTCTEIMPDIPPSPQAVAFNRLGDYQVNNNYGAPDINIPLFEIDFHGYKIPLSLHYEATPLKPGYNYDVTGLGWTLSGNSCVSRTIKDRADEYGRFNNPFILDSFYDQSGHLKRYMDYANELDWMNFQYDNYNIVLPSGRSIPFFMYKDNGAMTYKLLSSDSNVQIVCSYGSNSIDSFTVTDEQGVTYSFTVADKTSNGFGNDMNANRNVTWLLSSINIPSKGTITYNYTSLQTINTHTVSEPVIRVSRLTSEMPEDTGESRFYVARTLLSQCPRYKMRFISSISYGPTRVDFNYMPDGVHMKEMVVSDCNNTVRKYAFTINNSALTKLVISGQDDDEKLAYGFTYTNINPGNYTDYWGNRCNSSSYPNLTTDLGNFNMYFDYIGLDTTDLKTQLNSDGSLVRFIPKKSTDLSYYCKIKLQSMTNGDTRQPTSPQFHGVLSSISYPNGGYTTFTYENHRFPTATAADGDLVYDRRSQRIIEGGGFRIESITNYAADGTIASEDHYKYGFTYGEIIQQNFPLPLPSTYNINDHIGCGEAVVDPNLLTFMNYTHATGISTPLEFQKMVVGLPSAFKNITNIQGKATWWDAYFSTNTFRALLGNRRPVVYPEITVYHGNPYDPDECISKTVYKYDIYSYQLAPQNYYVSTFNQTLLPDTSYFEPLYYYNNQGMRCMENPAKRHQMKSKSDYSYNAQSGTWDLVSEENYSYSEETISQNGYIFDSNVSRGHCSHHTLQLGANRPLEDFGLFEFYQNTYQIFGKSAMCEKYTTTLREGGTRTWENTQVETYSYLYSGVLKSRIYTDVYDNEDLYSYVGEANENTNSVIAAMKSSNMLASLLSSETNTVYDGIGPIIISGNKVDYGSFGNGYDLLPFKLYERNGDVYEESIKFVSYDSCGNPTEIQDLRTGVHTAFLWDTYGRYLLAMIKNATWTQIQGVASQLMTGTSQSRYATIKTLLPVAQIQTWDYIPLVGVSSHTDINGQTILYEYDGLGRLKREKRVVNGTTNTETLREYEYNYMNPSL